MDKLVTNQTDVAFSYYNAMEKEVQKSATAEAHLFPLAFVMMIIYASNLFICFFSQIISKSHHLSRHQMGIVDRRFRNK
jgi:hypothetical protein